MITGKEDLLGAIIEAFTMEKGTKEFYDFAFLKAKDISAKEMFKILYKWEDSHMHYLGSLYQSIMEDRDILGYEEFDKKVLPCIYSHLCRTQYTHNHTLIHQALWALSSASIV